jgi:hypothetical protein
MKRESTGVLPNGDRLAVIRARLRSELPLPRKKIDEATGRRDARFQMPPRRDQLRPLREVAIVRDQDIRVGCRAQDPRTEWNVRWEKEDQRQERVEREREEQHLAEEVVHAKERDTEVMEKKNERDGA